MGAVYASFARTELCGVNPALSEMRAAGSLFLWRNAYKAGIVTCRSTLHVLHKRDARRNRFIAEALELHYAKWKANGVPTSPFHVLEAERNSLLKEGRSTFPLEDADIATGEPRILSGGNFLHGSDAVEGFAKWILKEIEAIEEAAFLARRFARNAPKP